MVHCVLGRVFSEVSKVIITFETSGTTHLTADRYVTKTSIFILSPFLFYSRGAHKGEGWLKARQPTPKQTREIRPCDLNWVRYATYNYVYMYINAVAINVTLCRDIYIYIYIYIFTICS